MLGRRSMGSRRFGSRPAMWGYFRRHGHSYWPAIRMSLLVDAMTLFSGAGKTTAQLGDGSDFAHIGGHVLLDPASGALLADVLPPWIHVRAALPQAAAFRWLLDRLGRRARFGSARCANSPPPSSRSCCSSKSCALTWPGGSSCPAGWLRALSDPRIAPAIRLMHGDPHARGTSMNWPARAPCPGRPSPSDSARSRRNRLL